jgi:hypothetical protein
MLPPLNIEDGLSQFRQVKKKIAALEADYQHALSNQQEFHVLKDILNQIKSLRESTPCWNWISFMLLNSGDFTFTKHEQQEHYSLTSHTAIQEF